MDLNLINKQKTFEENEDKRGANIVKIANIDNSKMLAEITPLIQKEFQGEYETSTNILDVPIIPIFHSSHFIAFAPYKQGDRLMVIPTEDPLDNVINSDEPVEPDLFRKFSEDDYVAFGGITKDEVTSPDPTSFIIYNYDSGSYIKLKQNGEVEINAPSGMKIIGNTEIVGNLNVSENTVTQGTTTTSGNKLIEGHTHEDKHGGQTGTF